MPEKARRCGLTVRAVRNGGQTVQARRCGVFYSPWSCLGGEPAATLLGAMVGSTTTQELTNKRPNLRALSSLIQNDSGTTTMLIPRFCTFIHYLFLFLKTAITGTWHLNCIFFVIMFVVSHRFIMYIVCILY